MSLSKLEDELPKKNLEIKATKKSKNLPNNAMSSPELLISRKINKLLGKLSVLFSIRYRENAPDGFIMPPWILPAPLRKQRNRRTISSLIPSREAPKLRMEDVRNVIGGRSRETIEITTEVRNLNQAIRDLMKYKNNLS